MGVSAFTSIFPPSRLSTSQSLSKPAHTRVTQAVGQTPKKGIFEVSKYRVVEVMECPTCNGKGFTIRQLAWWQKFLGLSEKVPCYCSFDPHLGTHVIVTWVDLESAQHSAHTARWWAHIESEKHASKAQAD